MRQSATRGLLTVMATGSVLASTAGYAYADASAIGAASDSPGVASGNTVQVPVSVPINACGDTVNVIGLLNPAMGNSCENGSHHGGASGGSGYHSGSGHQGGSGYQGGSGSQSGSGSQGNSGGQSGSGSQGNSGGPHHGGSGAGGSAAAGQASGSPGVGSGNNVQTPVSVPVNACGDSVTVIGGLNPVFGNHCAVHGSPWTPGAPVPPPHCSCAPPSTPPVTPPTHHSPPPPVVTPPKAAPPASVLPVTEHPAPPQTAVLASTGADGVDVLAPTAALLVLGGGVLYRRSRTSRR